MVLRHEAPVAGVGRVVAVVALHPVVVHLKGIFLSLLAIDEDLTITDLQVVAFIDLNRTLIDGDIIQCKIDGFALFGYPDGTVVIACPMHVTVQRIDLQIVSIGIQGHTLHNIFSALKRCDGVLCQWHIT